MKHFTGQLTGKRMEHYWNTFIFDEVSINLLFSFKVTCLNGLQQLEGVSHITDPIYFQLEDLFCSVRPQAHSFFFLRDTLAIWHDFLWECIHFIHFILFHFCYVHHQIADVWTSFAGAITYFLKLWCVASLLLLRWHCNCSDGREEAEVHIQHHARMADFVNKGIERVR